MDYTLEAKRDPMYRYLIVFTVCSSMGLQTWLTLFNNFAVDIAGLDGHHVGVIQSVREIPGFLALLAVCHHVYQRISPISPVNFNAGGGGGIDWIFSFLRRIDCDDFGHEFWLPLFRNHQHVPDPAIL